MRKATWEYSISPVKHAGDTGYVCSLPYQNDCRFIINRGSGIKSTPSKRPNLSSTMASQEHLRDPNTHKLTTSSQPGVPENWRTREEFVIEADGVYECENGYAE
jgi:hypothetical protein